MNDTAKTAAFLISAAVLCGLAVLTSPGNPVQDPEGRFVDQGQEFYPDFKDPLAAAALEVIAYDDESGTATPFKVMVKDGLWTIPSHYDYAADGKERLAKTASSIMDLRKDILASNRVEDHAAFGVIDPLDDAATSLKGRGQRITLRNETGGMLAEFIVGNAVEGKSGFRYVRVPDKKWTYAIKADVDLSTRFADWIETNLLDVSATDVVSLEIRDYSVDEGTGVVDVRDTIALTKSDNDWSISDLQENREVDQTIARKIPTSLAGIRITGVRPKPQGLSQDLSIGQGLQMDLGTRLSLTSKGFFLSTDGRLLSNEGEVSAGTQNGVRYTLRFGEVVFGEGLEISAGLGEDDTEPPTEATGPENRYLFVTTSFDAGLFGSEPQPPEGYVPTSELDPQQEQAGQQAPAPPADPAQPPAAGDATETGTADDAAGESTEQDAEAARAAELAEKRQQSEAYENALEDWNTKVADGQKRANELNARFAAWYYVISGDDFADIKVERSKLTKDKTPDSD